MSNEWDAEIIAKMINTNSQVKLSQTDALILAQGFLVVHAEVIEWRKTEMGKRDSLPENHIKTMLKEMAMKRSENLIPSLKNQCKETLSQLDSFEYYGANFREAARLFGAIARDTLRSIGVIE